MVHHLQLSTVEVERLLAGEREGRRLYRWTLQVGNLREQLGNEKSDESFLPHRQAWAEAKQGKENSRRASLAKSLQESLRTKSRPASPEYEVSLATASYEYDVVAS